MPLENIKLAAYLDEAEDDPILACKVIASHKLNYVVLRTAWGHNICQANDQACGKLKKSLQDNNLSVVAIASDLGYTSHEKLLETPTDKIDRLFNLAAYFQVGMVRIGCGTGKRTNAKSAIVDWCKLISAKCLHANLVPLFEISDDSTIRNPVELAELFSTNRRWKFWYDPAQLITKQNLDPFTKYWTLLKSVAGAIDVRDYKIGYGYKAAGYGDAKIDLTIKDGISGLYKGWYFLEPSLGRRHGQANGKSETFALAVSALENMLSSS